MIARLREQPERLVQWTAIALWAVMPFSFGAGLIDALDSWDHNPWVIDNALFSLGWIALMTALALPSPITLTIARVGVPATLPVGVWIAIESDDGTLVVLALVSAVLVTAIVLSSAFGDRFIDGGSYSDERRFALRPPGPVLIGVLFPTWAVAIAGALAGPLLLGDRQWILGAVVLAAGWPVTYLAARALHQLARRFIVFVPNGIVVHDLTAMREPVLFQKREVAGIAPALADTTAADLTNAALGLALELKLASTVELPIVTGRSTTEEQKLRSMLVSPSRPASLLTVAQERDYRIT